MPTYAYRCVECGHEFEELQSMSAEPLVKCPNCGKNSLKRGLGGGTGMIFKGQGFYQTDYKKSGGEKNSAPVTNGKASKDSASKDKPEKETGKKPPDKSEGKEK